MKSIKKYIFIFLVAIITWNIIDYFTHKNEPFMKVFLFCLALALMQIVVDWVWDTKEEK
ncbi:hypothetical protein [Viridibacillus arvi]|uniref:hypothetical protein n=1 Tax=Viridibacillus arvi TaxID=263475 RepID=UPI0037F3DFB1